MANHESSGGLFKTKNNIIIYYIIPINKFHKKSNNTQSIGIILKRKYDMMGLYTALISRSVLNLEIIFQQTYFSFVSYIMHSTFGSIRQSREANFVDVNDMSV